MTDSSFTSRRFAWGKGSKAKKQPQRVRPQVEALEDRVVPSYFPPTTSGIHIFEDQLPSSLSSAMLQFLATHTDGTQKILLNQTAQFRAINPNFTVLHYQLGTGNSPYDYIMNNQWASDWSSVNQQESWFAHQSYSGELQSASPVPAARIRVPVRRVADPGGMTPLARVPEPPLRAGPVRVEGPRQAPRAGGWDEEDIRLAVLALRYLARDRGRPW